MLTPLEINIGHASCGELNHSIELFDTLGQGKAHLYFARMFARLSRQNKDKGIYFSERLTYEIARTADTFYYMACLAAARHEAQGREGRVSV